MTDRLEQSKALASEARLKILSWLKDPGRHFPHQESGDPNDIGVCVTLITDKLKLSQPTVSKHLDLLMRAKFVRVERVGRWSYFSRDEKAIKQYRSWINDTL
jgi:DNA-binding transcriptional ArsR family regulator